MVSKSDPKIRFWRRVQKGDPKECWPWIGHITPKGYGAFTPFPKHTKKGERKPFTWRTHRLAWVYTNGEIPDGLECCHHCDNTACCNPAHLYVGTHKRNMEDMVNRGRVFHPKGELHGEHKLTERQVVQIRKLYTPGVVSYNMLAKMFGVSKKLILLVVQRKYWRHVA